MANFPTYCIIHSFIHSHSMNVSDTSKFLALGRGYGMGTYRRGACRSCQYCMFTREGWKCLAAEYLK